MAIDTPSISLIVSSMTAASIPSTAAMAPEYDLVIFDEIMASVNGGVVSQESVLDFLDGKPESLEVVLTGRDPSEAIQERADYISQIQAVRHPYEQGIGAREGIEY